jgi:hypothetical protein
MREIGVVGAYARGWTAFILQKVWVSLTICAVVAGVLMWGELTPEAQAGARDFVRASAVAALVPTRVISMHAPAEWSGTAAEAAARWATLFGGRTCGFLLWQWLLRTLVGACLLAPTLTVGVLLLGRYLTGDKHRRGSQVLDTTSWAYVHRPQIVLVVVMALGGLITGLAAVAYVATPSGLSMLPHVCLAWLAMHSEGVAALVSPGWRGAVIWTPNPIGQLLRPAESYTAALGTLGDAGLVSVALVGLFGTGCGAYTAGYLWQRRKRQTVEDRGELVIGGVRIPRMREVFHFLLSGATGTGKSVAISRILEIIRERCQRAIVCDTSGEYVARHFRPGIDVILNAADVRAAAWTPWADMRRPSDALTMGESLFPRSDARNDFWALAGSSVFAGMLEKLRAWGAERNTHLAYLAERLGSKQLMDVLKGTVGERFVDSGARETATSIVMTTAAQLRSFRFLRDPRAGERPFSIRDFVEDESTDRWLFVVMRDEDAAVMKPLVSLWLDIAISAVLSLPAEDETLPHDKRRRLFVFLDELQALQKLPALDGALLRGRKKGLSVTLGIQSIKGVRAIYGNNEADALLGQPQTQLVLRTPEEGTAKWLEGQLGSAEIMRAGESQQVGMNSKQHGGVNLQRSVVQEAAVLAAEIQDLPDLEGYLKVVGEPVKRVHYTPGDLKPSQPGFVQAPEVGEPVAPDGWRATVLYDEARDAFSDGKHEWAKKLMVDAARLAAGRDPELVKRMEFWAGGAAAGASSSASVPQRTLGCSEVKRSESEEPSIRQ